MSSSFQWGKGTKHSQKPNTPHGTGRGLHHDPNSSDYPATLPWPEAGGEKGLSFMTWAYVYIENVLIKFLFAPWCAVDLP